MSTSLTQSFALPESTCLAKRIYKRMLHENAKLGARDKRILSEDVDIITWTHTLKPGTVPIAPYADSQCEYNEIAVIEMLLRSPKQSTRIAEIVHRAIPYPVALTLSVGPRAQLSLATKRFSEAEKDVVVANEFFSTEWLNLDELTPCQGAFADSLALPGLPHTDFHGLYNGWIDRVVALQCARRTGAFRLPRTIEEATARRVALAACRKLEASIAEERAALRKESQFNRQVDHNVRIKTLEGELTRHVATL